MTDDEKKMTLFLVDKMMSEHPTEFRSVIDAAVAGVEAFAESQRDTSSALSARLITILELNKVTDFGHFDAKSVLETLEPGYGGTVALKDLYKKYTKKG